MERKREHMLKCTTPQGVKRIPISQVFSDSFIKEIEDVDAKALSLAEYMDEMLVMAGATVGATPKECVTVHAKPLATACDVDKYSVDVVVDMRGAISTVQQLCGDDAPCAISLRDAILCYAVADAYHFKLGAKVMQKEGRVGIQLVDDPNVTPKYTLVQLITLWRDLKRVAKEREHMRCACSDVVAERDSEGMLSWLVALAGKQRGQFEGTMFEFLPDGKFQQHHAGVCDWDNDDAVFRPHVMSVDDLKAAVSPGFDRYIHDAKQLCCGADCDCSAYGVREMAEGAWLVANRFVCKGTRIKGTNHIAEALLREVGFDEDVDPGDQVSWFSFSKPKLRVWLDDVVAGRTETFGYELAAGECGCTRLEMLLAWFDYIHEGRLGLLDVLRATDFNSVTGANVAENRRVWNRYHGMEIAGYYQCPCEGNHEVCGRDKGRGCDSVRMDELDDRFCECGEILLDHEDCLYTL